MTEVPRDVNGVSGDGPFVTECFRITPATYLRASSGKALLWSLAIMALPLAACLIASFFDIRWGFVALILLFLVFPMAMTYIYFDRLLTAGARRALSPKHLSIHPEGSIAIIYESADEENRPPETELVRFGDISDVTVMGRYLVISVSGMDHQLIIPLEHWPREYDWNKICPHDGNSYCQPS